MLCYYEVCPKNKFGVICKTEARLKPSNQLRIFFLRAVYFCTLIPADSVHASAIRNGIKHSVIISHIAEPFFFICE